MNNGIVCADISVRAKVDVWTTLDWSHTTASNGNAIIGYDTVEANFSARMAQECDQEDKSGGASPILKL